MEKRTEEKRFKYLLAIISIVFTFLYLSAITFAPIPQNNVRFADTIMGALITLVLATVYNYFFGSSEGSHRKTDMIDKLSDDQSPQP